MKRRRNYSYAAGGRGGVSTSNTREPTTFPITLPAQDSSVSPQQPVSMANGAAEEERARPSLWATFSPGCFCVTLNEAAAVIALAREESCLFPL